MVYFDRLLMATLVPAKTVAWYVTAQEVMLRMLVIPGALSAVLFPQFAGASNLSERPSQASLYESGIRAMGALMLPLCVLAAAGACDAMRVWMGEPFAVDSHRVAETIAVGIFANSIAQLPFAWLQGTGHSKSTGQLQIAELPLYVLGLYVCIGQ
jgi:O-antigen/teichoic acid export membrane protein